MLKRYSVYVVFSNGQDMQFETNTNLLLQQPVNINGAKMVMTEEQRAINIAQIEKMEIVEIGKGKIGEVIKS